MPIYAYRCDECGFAKDVLQKLSDSPLTQCLSCGNSTFKKQLTAAGFQLKGTGWYATDFRGGAAPKEAASSSAEAPVAKEAGAVPTAKDAASAPAAAPTATRTES